jgi:hypothetical protein
MWTDDDNMSILIAFSCERTENWERAYDTGSDRKDTKGGENNNKELRITGFLDFVHRPEI